MAKRSAFVLPAGLDLQIDGDTLSLRHDGDVVLETTLGRKLGSVEVTGDLTVKLDKAHGSLKAGGVLTVTGDVDAERLQGREVVIEGKVVKARSVSASERITLGATKLQVDVVIAPEIRVDPNASGRVIILEARNEVGPSKIKGAFNLAEYDDTFGNAAEFLAERGLAPLGEASPVAEPMAIADEAPAPVAPPIAPPAPPPLDTAPAARPKDDEESTEDPASLSVDDMEPIGSEVELTPDEDDDLAPRLTDALAKVVACYDVNDLPPPVAELRLLIEQRDYTGLRQNITEVWNGLLGFHQKRGIRPHYQVTHAFNVIHGLVQE